MEDQASTSQSKNLGTSITAQNDATVVIPLLSNCHIEGHLNIHVNAHSSANNQQILPTSHGATGIGKTDAICSPTLSQEDKDLKLKVQLNLKRRLQEQLKVILEGITEKDIEGLIQPQHYIQEDLDRSREHEIWRIEKTSLNPAHQVKVINSSDIFKPASDADKPCKTVLTLGISGIGKTVAVQKFVFDWAEGKVNQDVDFVFLLPFWELEILKDGDQDLQGLLCKFYPELKDLNPKVYEKSKVVFILDGLDESREFFKSEKLFYRPKMSPLGELVLKLIKGELLPSAQIWITSRPLAAEQILPYTNRVTEIHGFSDQQKEQYFRKIIRDQKQADKIILHIKSMRNLYIMCRIPSFCCIATTVLQRMMDNSVSGEFPTTQTEMYACFVLNKAKGINEIVRLSDSDVKAVIGLGNLAFRHLRDNIVVTEEDLSNCGIAANNITMYSQAPMSILREEKPMIPDLKRYRFLHSGVQEFLAALFVLHSYTLWGIQKFQPIQERENQHGNIVSADSEFNVPVKQQNTLHDLLRVALDNALARGDGHLDILLRFLLGLSLAYPQNSLSELIGDTEHSQENIQKTVRYIIYLLKNKNSGFSHPKCINLLYCLAELKDHSFEEEILNFLQSCSSAADKLSIEQCSVFAHLVQVSGAVYEKLDVGNLCLYSEGQRRLLTVMGHFKNVLLVNIYIFDRVLDSLISALESPDSQLRELDLSHSSISSAKFTRLCPALQKSRLQSLNLSHVDLACIPESEQRPEPTSLDFLNIYFHKLRNDVLNSFEKKTTGWEAVTCGIKVLRALGSGPEVKLHTLKLKDCDLSNYSCEILASSSTILKELDLSYNHLTDAGVQEIYQKLRNSVLEILRLDGCRVSGVSCKALHLALPQSQLKELHLGHSGIGDDGLKYICRAIQMKSMLTSLGLSYCNLTVGSCEALASALRSDSSVLRELDLSNNDLEDSGLKLLSTGLKSEQCKLQILRLSGCMITEEGCSALASALTSNPSHLRELDLSYNHPGEAGERLLSAKLEDPNCKLETLDMNHGGEHRMKLGLKKYACDIQNISLTPFSTYDWERFLDEFSGLSEGRFYWQVEWNGSVQIGVKYKDETHHKPNQWFLHCTGGGIFFNSFAAFSKYSEDFKQLGVYLDYSAGMLSFYEVSSDIITCLHRVHHRFDKPLYPFVFSQSIGFDYSVKIQAL